MIKIEDALSFEASGDLAGAERCYRLLLKERPDPAANINLGTILYNRAMYVQAEAHYRAALQIDPNYALAYFNLGNCLDETGRIEEAIQSYKTALNLATTYADAHYNLAIAYTKLKQPESALIHWRLYVKLDFNSPYGTQAKKRITWIIKHRNLKIVSRRKKPKRTDERAKLELVNG